MNGIFVGGPTIWQLIVGLFAVGGWYLVIRAAWNRRTTLMAVLIGVAVLLSVVSLYWLLST